MKNQAELNAHSKDKHPDKTDQFPKCKIWYKLKSTIENHQNRGRKPAMLTTVQKNELKKLEIFLYYFSHSSDISNKFTKKIKNKIFPKQNKIKHVLTTANQNEIINKHMI